MLRRLDNLTSYYFVATNGQTFCVTMEKLKNTRCGCPRWKAYITNQALITYNCAQTKVYTFQGHYYNELGEARHILETTENVTLQTI